MKLRSRNCSRAIAVEIRSFCSSVIGSMLSASIIYLCRRISDDDILLNFRLQMFFCGPSCDTGANFVIAAGKRFDWVLDFVAFSCADLVRSTTSNLSAALTAPAPAGPRPPSWLLHQAALDGIAVHVI
jgi:hypothetical protein